MQQVTWSWRCGRRGWLWGRILKGSLGALTSRSLTVGAPSISNFYSSTVLLLLFFILAARYVLYVGVCNYDVLFLEQHKMHIMLVRAFCLRDMQSISFQIYVSSPEKWNEVSLTLMIMFVNNILYQYFLIHEI